MVINNLVELTRRGYIEIGDELRITIKDTPFRLTIRDEWIHTYGYHNDYILEILGYKGSEKTQVMKQLYGYEPGAGEWPECTDGDTNALYRAVKWLYESAGYSYYGTIPPEIVYDLDMGDEVVDKITGEKGFVMTIDGAGRGAVVTITHPSGVAMRFQKDLTLINKNNKHEHLQAKAEPIKGSKGSSGTGISGGGSATGIGCRYPGNETCCEEIRAEIGRGKIIGTVLKF